MKKSLLLFTIIYCFSCQEKNPACGKGSHNAIYLQNNSGVKIHGHFYWQYQYPDTTIGPYNPLYDGTAGVSPTQTNYLNGSIRGDCFESTFGDGSKKWVYIFSQDSLENIPWDTIVKTHRGVLQKKVIDLDYLKKNNFVITYP